MATAANPSALAAQARRVYVEALLLGVPATVKAVVAREVAARLVLYVSTLRPLLEAAEIPFVTPPPATRKLPARPFHRRRRSRSAATG